MHHVLNLSGDAGLLEPFFGATGDDGTAFGRQLELHDGAEVVGLFHQLDSIDDLHDGGGVGIDEIVGDDGLQVGGGVRLRHVEHIGHHLSISEGVVNLTGFEQKGETGQLTGTGINVDTSEVVGEDGGDGLTGRLELLPIESVEQIEGFAEDVA